MKSDQLLADFLRRQPLKRVLDSESLACRDAEATEALMGLGSAGVTASVLLGVFTRKLTKLEAERRKLLEAYYASAIDVELLRSEQQRIASEVREVEWRLQGVEATLAEWQEVLTIAFKFAEECGQAYRKANDRTRKLYNSAVFRRLAVRNGEIAEVEYREPFSQLFVVPGFAQGGVERETGLGIPSATDYTEFRLPAPREQLEPRLSRRLRCAHPVRGLQGGPNGTLFEPAGPPQKASTPVIGQTAQTPGETRLWPAPRASS